MAQRPVAFRAARRPRGGRRCRRRPQSRRRHGGGARGQRVRRRGSTLPAATSRRTPAARPRRWARASSASCCGRPTARSRPTSCGRARAADSGHEEGRALDWMVNMKVPEQKAMAKAFITWLQAPTPLATPRPWPAGWVSATSSGTTGRGGRETRPAAGRNTTAAPAKDAQAAYANTCHRNHVHVSFSWDGALQADVLLQRAGRLPGAARAVPTMPAATAGPRVAPVPAARRLDTRPARGSPTGPCRVHPDAALRPARPGPGRGAGDGVAAVMLRVTSTALDAPADLPAVWPAAPPRPSPTAPRRQRRAAVARVTVPVRDDRHGEPAAGRRDEPPGVST